MSSSPPDLRKNIFKSLTYKYLYLKRPDSFEKTLAAARDYFSTDPEPPLSGGILVNIACGYGQAYFWVKNSQVEQITIANLRFRVKQESQPPEKDSLQMWIEEQTFLVISEVVRRDDKWIPRLRALMGLDPRPEANREDNDLEVFKDIERIVNLLSVRVPNP